jgi:hypothetical protein
MKCALYGHIAACEIFGWSEDRKKAERVLPDVEQLEEELSAATRQPS